MYDKDKINELVEIYKKTTSDNVFYELYKEIEKYYDYLLKKKFRHLRYYWEDMKQTCNIELVKYVRKYDSSRNSNFFNWYSEKVNWLFLDFMRRDKRKYEDQKDKCDYIEDYQD